MTSIIGYNAKSARPGESSTRKFALNYSPAIKSARNAPPRKRCLKIVSWSAKAKLIERPSILIL